MQQIGLSRTNLVSQEHGHAIVAALLLGSRLSQVIRIHWIQKESVINLIKENNEE